MDRNVLAMRNILRGAFKKLSFREGSKMRRRLCQFVVVIVSIVLIVSTSGCLQLKEIRDFSALAGNLGDQFPVLARDLFTSCMSQQGYIVAQKMDFRFDKFGDLFNDNNKAMASGNQLCVEAYKDGEDDLIKANATLVAYLKTLGDLAADDL